MQRFKYLLSFYKLIDDVKELYKVMNNGHFNSISRDANVHISMEPSNGNVLHRESVYTSEQFGRKPYLRVYVELNNGKYALIDTRFDVLSKIFDETPDNNLLLVDQNPANNKSKYFVNQYLSNGSFISLADARSIYPSRGYVCVEVFHYNDTMINQVDDDTSMSEKLYKKLAELQIYDKLILSDTLLIFDNSKERVSIKGLV